MKIWITGASGLSGRAVTKILSESFDVFASGFSRLGEGLSKVDLTSETEVERVFMDVEPDAVIHLAAERNPDVCENNHLKTVKLNVESSRRLASLCKKYNSWLLYMSTDYVFDGSNPPYEVDDKTRPLNFYGDSKLKGEEAVLSELSSACILRVPVLYGGVENLGESAVTSIAKSLLSKEEVSVDHWAIRYPTLVDDVGRTIEMMLKVLPSGIFHYSASESMTKYEILKIMASELNLPFDHAKPVPGKPAGAPRPYNCQLSVSALKEIDCYAQPTSISTVIGEILSKHI